MIKKVILDTDPGIDDAMAILLAHSSPQIQLIGLTTTFGNASIDNTTRNALYLKEAFNLNVDIAKGVDTPLKISAGEPASIVHGQNGLGDIQLPQSISESIECQVAHHYIIETIKANPNEITLIAIGRLTNLALALRHAPEIAGLVKEVIIMGGAFGHHGHTGNLTPFAEANIYGDPHAADEVFQATWPVTVVGLDVTQQSFMSQSYLTELKERSQQYGNFIYDISRYYASFYKDDLGLDGFYVHDSSAVIYAMAPELFTTQAGQIRVVTEGVAMGHTLFKADKRHYPIDGWSNNPKHQICTNVDGEALIALYMNTVC